MTWTARYNDFTTLCAIYDGERLVAENVGKGDAERIVDEMNGAEAEWEEMRKVFGGISTFPSEAIVVKPEVETPFVYLDGEIVTGSDE